MLFIHEGILFFTQSDLSNNFLVRPTQNQRKSASTNGIKSPFPTIRIKTMAINATKENAEFS